jgi:hypothetical protein
VCDRPRGRVPDRVAPGAVPCAASAARPHPGQHGGESHRAQAAESHALATAFRSDPHHCLSGPRASQRHFRKRHPPIAGASCSPRRPGLVSGSPRCGACCACCACCGRVGCCCPRTNLVAGTLERRRPGRRPGRRRQSPLARTHVGPAIALVVSRSGALLRPHRFRRCRGRRLRSRASASSQSVGRFVRPGRIRLDRPVSIHYRCGCPVRSDRAGRRARTGHQPCAPCREPAAGRPRPGGPRHCHGGHS